MTIDERKVPLDIRDTRAQPGVDEEKMGFQNVEGPGADDYGIPGSEEARSLGTGSLPQPREDGRTRPQPEQAQADRVIDDRNVAVDGAVDGAVDEGRDGGDA